MVLSSANAIPSPCGSPMVFIEMRLTSLDSNHALFLSPFDELKQNWLKPVDQLV
jgi:hypothetical protein